MLKPSRCAAGVALAAVIVVGASLATVNYQGAANADPLPLTETSPANEVANLIQSAGETSYSASFAGVEPIDNTDVTIYTTSSATSLMSYANGVAGANSVTLTQTVVTNSLAQLDADTSTIADAWETLADEGINIAQVGPNIDTHQVEVVLAPSPVPHPLQSDYIDAAQSAVDSLVGSGVALVTGVTSGYAVLDDSRTDDSSPFTGAIRDLTPWMYCTTSWKVIDNASGDPGVLSAGHCGPGDVVEASHQSRQIGTTTTRFFQNGTATDLEEIAGESYNNLVWKAGSNTYLPTEAGNAAYHSLVSLNGSFSSEHTGLRVQHINLCIIFEGIVEICGLDSVLRNDDSTNACAQGDSGGPAYHRLNATQVRVAGMIEGQSHDGIHCYFENITPLETTGNFTLVLS